MVRGSAVPARLSRLAAGQWGLLTTAQAEREGVTRLQLARLADAEVLERVDRGVYVMTAATDEHVTLRAAWLVLDPAHTAEQRLTDPIAAGVVSHTSATGLHGLGELLDDVAEFTFPERKQSRRAMRLHRGALATEDVTLVDGLPVTTIERTIADLLADGQDLEHVAQIIGQAIDRDQLDLQTLSANLEPLAHRHGHDDGRSFSDALLDLVGLSPRGLLHNAAATSVGRELFTAGAIAALQRIFSSAMPNIDVSGLLAGVDVRGMVETDAITKALENVETRQALTARMRAQLAALSSPTVEAIMALNQPALDRLAETIERSYAQPSGTRPCRWARSPRCG